MIEISSLARKEVLIDAGATQGPLEWWRHALGHGGINTLPLPPRVVEGVAKLKPRLIRVFLQEHFAIYPDHGRFDWTRLDPFLEAMARTGAKVVAAITIKPKVLFPKVDHAIWRPNNTAEWQRVIYELVKRYSVDKPIVTHWEIGNETDIGESGGSPYLIPDPADYAEHYRMTIKPIREAFPSAKVGGPASCWVDNEPLPGLIKACRETGTPLDFISWHCYHDDPARHALGVKNAKALLEGFPGRRPEMLVTEWSKSFDRVSFEDLAFEPRRAAIIAAAILAMIEAGLDWSFYYHIWDQVFYPEPFRPFFSEEGIGGMETHWNRVPHRFGLFGVGEEVRPQYFVYQMLGRAGEERIAAQSDDGDLRVLAGRAEGRLAALIVNLGLEQSRPMLVTLRLSGLAPGGKTLTVHRIDASRRWSQDALELVPVERRETYAPADFHCQLYCPADSVALLTLDDLDREPAQKTS
jgi:hypothetical protein